MHHGTVRLPYVIVMMIAPLWAQTAFPESQEAILASFEKRVAQFEKLLSLKPKILDKQSFSKSPTGYIYLYQHINNHSISYGVQKTDSLVSPYVGYIILKYPLTESNDCGDIPTYIGAHAFSQIDLARKDNPSCYVENKKTEMNVKFIFTFQKEKWIFKEAINMHSGKPDPLFSTALGKPTEGRY